MGAVSRQVPIEQQAIPIVGVATGDLGVAPAGAVRRLKCGAAINVDVDPVGVTNPSRDETKTTLKRPWSRIF